MYVKPVAYCLVCGQLWLVAVILYVTSLGSNEMLQGRGGAGGQSYIRMRTWAARTGGGQRLPVSHSGLWRGRREPVSGSGRTGYQEDKCWVARGEGYLVCVSEHLT